MRRSRRELDALEHQSRGAPERGAANARKESKMNRRALLAMLPACMATPAAFAEGTAASAPETAAKYVVMSLVGDKFAYVNASGGVTGSNVNRNTLEERWTFNELWDTTALQVIAGVVPQVVPGATMSFLKGSSPAYFSDQADWFDGDKVTLPKPLEAAILRENAPYLLLLTKWRGEAAIRDANEPRGHGKIAGLGFYSDSQQEVTSTDAIQVGFTAPYLYAKLSLVDLSSMRVLRESLVQASSIRKYRDFDQGALQDVLIDGVRDAVTRVLKPA